MFHVRQGRRKFVPGVHRADARWGGAPQGPGRAGTETVLLPSDDPLPCGTHRRSVAVRLKDLAPRRRTRGEGFLGLQSFESFRWVRGVAWFERGAGWSSRSQEILPAWGAGDSGSNPDGPMPIRVGADSLSEVQSHEIDNRGCRLALRIEDLAATVPSGSGRRTEGRDPHVVDSPVDEGQRRGPHPVRSARVRQVAVLLAPGWAQGGVHRE